MRSEGCRSPPLSISVAGDVRRRLRDRAAADASRAVPVADGRRPPRVRVRCDPSEGGRLPPAGRRFGSAAARSGPEAALGPPVRRGGSSSMKKSTLPIGRSALFTDLRCFELLRYDRFAGANACARTAVDALVGVDNVDVAGRNSLDRALADAGAASHAGVRDFVSHVCKIFVLVCCVFCAANIRKLFDDVKSGIRN